MFSSRTGWKLAANELTRRLEARRRSGLAVLDLTESNPTHCEFHYPAAILEAVSRPEALRYDPHPSGTLEGRRAVAAYYVQKNVVADPEQVVLTASTSEAYSFLFCLLADPEDEILVPRPSYPLFDFLTELHDAKACPYPVVYRGQWSVDLAAVEAAIGPRTRALIVVNPNNPTGSFLRREERDGLLNLCRRRGLALIADEVFLDYAFDGAKQSGETLAGASSALTFTLSGLSKVVGLPQMKLAWIVASGPPDLVGEALARLEVIGDTYLSVNTPVQVALARLLGLRDEIQGQILERVRSNRRYLLGRLRQMHTEGAPGPPSAVECLHADGGWYVVLRVPLAESEETLALRLLDEQGVLVHPGYFFDFEEEGYLVVSLLPPEETFREGISRLLSGVHHA